MSVLKYFQKRDATEASTSTAIVNESENNEDSDIEVDSDKEVNPEINPAKKSKTEPIRKYDENYLLYGFICGGTEDLPLPTCIFCDKSLKNCSMKPSHLKRHQKSKHKDEMGKPLEFFKQKKDEWKSQRKSIGEFVHFEMKAIKSSYVVADRIAREKKSFTIGEILLKPAMDDVVKIMLGDAAASKIDSVPLSADTINRRIREMAQDVQQQLSEQLGRAGIFCLQFDESTDIAGEAILIGFVRYPHNNEIVENLFCHCSLPEHTTGEQVFLAIDSKMKEMNLDWKNVVGVCTDGASAMTGKKSGLAKRISEVAHADFESSYCILHRESLASKKLSSELDNTLKSVVKMINMMLK